MKLLTLRKLHKWVALIVGLQLLLWSVSGLVFAWLDHHVVAGHTLARTPAPPALDPKLALLAPDAILADFDGQRLREVRLQSTNGEWLYRIEHASGVELRRASDGSPYEIDQATARAVALEHYAGTGRLAALTYHAGPTLETRKFGPSWQASFDDRESTSLYVAADDGRFLVARGSTWRVFDFFWMLHTMDYVGRDDFNNPLVILCGFAALWIALTGILLVRRVTRRTDFGLPEPKGGR